MGFRFKIQILSLLGLLLTLGGCGDFAGFDDPDDPDTGDLEEFRIYLTSDEKLTLTNSIFSGEFAQIKFDDERSNGYFEEYTGAMRIRGNSSRYMEKKSYTLKLGEGDDEVRYALDAGGDVWFEYGLTMYLSNYLETGAPSFSPVALYVNDEYEGYYNIVELYNEDLNDMDRYDDEGGQLFKADFEYDEGEMDIHSLSEKKFPDDDDFSIYDRLIVNYENMDSDEWVDWIESSGVADFDTMSDYMILLDFFGYVDVHRGNYYVYFHDGGFTVLPWDTDGGYTYCNLGGNNTLTERMLESDEYKAMYTDKMDDYFMDGNPELLDLARDYVDEMYTLLKEASEVEPYHTSESFEDEYDNLQDFFNDRPDDIRTNQPEWGF